MTHLGPPGLSVSACCHKFPFLLLLPNKHRDVGQHPQAYLYGVWGSRSPTRADRHVREPLQHRHTPCVAWAGWTSLEQPFQKDIVRLSDCQAIFPSRAQVTLLTPLPFRSPGPCRISLRLLATAGTTLNPPTPVDLTDAQCRHYRGILNWQWGTLSTPGSSDTSWLPEPRNCAEAQ